jgi:hypothetical protein
MRLVDYESRQDWATIVTGVECPICGQPPGYMCRELAASPGATGMNRADYHSARKSAAIHYFETGQREEPEEVPNVATEKGPLEIGSVSQYQETEARGLSPQAVDSDSDAEGGSAEEEEEKVEEIKPRPRRRS